VSRPGVLLDRDGTIIVDTGYVGSVDRVEFIDGAAEAIAALNRAGLPVAVVTNQAGVARGYYGIEDVEQVHKYMIAELARHGAHVDLWLFCPYHTDGVVPAFARPSADRKPGPGMALAAAQALDLDLTASWVVGDSPSDVGLAEAVGARPLHVGPPSSAVHGVDTYPDLAAAVRVILGAEDLTAPAGHTGAAGVPKFPAARFHRADSYGGAYVNEITRAFGTVDLEQISRAAKILTSAHDRDATIFACGNGGSASIANHLQCDHLKGVRNGTGLTTRVHSLSTNVELFSAIANDLGYEQVFEYQLQSQARPGDVLIVISSSGRSPNILRALDWAAAHEVATIALTGFEGGPARSKATVSVHVDSVNYGVIEDVHQGCMHLLAQYVRQARMTPDAVVSQTF
jgi:histidinol-phosphate phosphatase family protein